MTTFPSSMTPFLSFSTFRTPPPRLSARVVDSSRFPARGARQRAALTDLLFQSGNQRCPFRRQGSQYLLGVGPIREFNVSACRDTAISSEPDGENLRHTNALIGHDHQIALARDERFNGLNGRVVRVDGMIQSLSSQESRREVREDYDFRTRQQKNVPDGIEERIGSSA